MSIAYQSWEVASGPTMGFKMAIQSNMCAVWDVLGSDAPNYMSSVNSSPEAFTKTVANHTVFPPQETVIRGLSSLSLHAQPQLEANSPSEDCNSMPVCKSSSKSMELSHCPIVAGNDSTGFNSAARGAGHLVQGTVLDSQSSTTLDQNLIPQYRISREGAANVVSTGSAFLTNPHTSGARNSTRTRGSSMPWIFSPLHEGHGNSGLYGFSNTYRSPKKTLDVVAEDKPWEEGSSVIMCDHVELDTLSSSSTDSFSSLQKDEPAEFSSSFCEGLYGVGDAEVQSEFKGPSSLSVGFSPPRKGLSRFYAGKSRSFSCLADVVSLKDLAKPESPYAKKRKCNVGRSSNVNRPQLPPLQKGAASISKKSVYNGKSTLLLAVAMSTREDVHGVENKDTQWFAGVQRRQSSPLTARSYSLSDLQGVAGSHISPC